MNLGALLWDFDGLLLDTESSAYEVACEIWSEHGVELQLDTWHQVVGSARLHWTELLAAELGTTFDDEARARLVATRVERHAVRLEHVGPQPGAVELLAAATEAGVACAVASSSTDEWVERHLVRHGLRHHFAAIVTRDLVGPHRTKPHPDLFLCAAGMLGVEPERCVVLEDSPVGVEAARHAGAAVVAVPAGITRDLPFPDADLVVGSLAELDLATLDALVVPPRRDRP